MKYIAEANARTKVKVAKEDKINKEAAKKSQAAERKTKKKTDEVITPLTTYLTC